MGTQGRVPRQREEWVFDESEQRHPEERRELGRVRGAGAARLRMPGLEDSVRS